MGVPLNSWFIRENAIEMDDWGVPLFQETLIHIYIYISSSLRGSQGWAPHVTSIASCQRSVISRCASWIHIDGWNLGELCRSKSQFAPD